MQGARHLGVLACAAFMLLASPWADAAYVQVYNTIQKGAITFTGNTLALNGNATAQSGVPGTSSTGGAFIAEGISPLSYFGGFNATFYGAGAVGTTNDWTKNASRAVLNIPVGATVLYAELIWSGTNGAAINASRSNAVKFITPAGTYTVSPSATTANDTGTFYTRSANVTGLVQIGRGGNYTVGGVPAIIATGGATDAAGWTLAVAYADPAQVARNLTIFVGNEPSGAAAATVSGFCTPVAGPVNGRLMTSGIEGDSSGVNDAMRFGPTATLSAANNLSGPNSQSLNFFGSQINGDTGTRDTTGTYGGFNSTALATASASTAGARQGYDITNVDASSQLTNSQTTASAQGITAGDVYAINALAMQINVTSPIFPVTVKSVNKTSTFVGDTLRYSVNLDNTAGNGAANNVTFFDAIPPGMVLVPNSVTINGAAQAGANPATGVPVGNVAVGAVVTVAFDVTVVSLPASPAPARFDNSARWTYTYIACAGVVAQAGEVATAPVSTPAARLEPVKTVSPTGQLVGGQTATYTISIPNTGLLDTAGTTLADPIPAGTVYVAGSTKLNGVAVADGPGSTMPFAIAAPVNSAGKAAGVIAFGATATVQFSVAATGGGTVNNVATIDPDGSGPGTALTVSAVNSGFAGPSVAKAFVPSTIGAGGKSTLTVTLTNPNAAVITGVSVTDNLPSGMVIANPANATTTCVGGTTTATPSGTTLALGGASLPASGSCTFSADVTVATAGSYTNTIPANAVSSNNAGVSTAGSQTLTVTAAPSVSKSFVPSTVAPNAVSTLTITLSNPTATALTAVSFSDIFPTTAAGAPGNMTLFDATVTNSCGGTLTTAAGAALAVGSDSVKLTGGTIAATNVCTITVRVKAPTGGAYGNVIPIGALTTSGGANTAAAQATLQIASPQVDKTFGLAPGVKELTVAANTATILRITLTNVTGAVINTLAFTDTYPAGLVNANTTTTNTCGGAATASATATNPGTLILSGATTLAAGASCEITANVQSATSGSYTNTIAAGGVTSSIGANVAATSATLNVARPNITKAFGAATVPLNSTATLTITLSNPTATAMTGAAFTDTLPAGLTAATPGGTCVGTKAASGSTVSISGGTIPANGSCTVIAVITGTTVGLKINTIPAGGLTVTGPAAGSSGTAATDDITVLAPPTISKSFLTSPILPVTGVSTLQIVLANSNSVAVTGATFTDTFPTTPGLMTLANLTTTNSCGGTLNNNLGAALAVGAAGIQLTGGVIPSNGSCTITVNVKASVTGDYVNTIPGAPTTGFLNTGNSGGSTIAATAPLSVRLAAPMVAKSFSPSTIVANTATTMTLTITNPSTVQAITGVAWSDIFPAGMKVFSTPNFTNSCGGTVTAGNLAGETSFALSGATVPFNAGGTGNCTITVQVTSSQPAASPGVTNTTGTVTSTNANTSLTTSGNLIVTPPPLTAITIAKAFSPTSIASGGISSIVFSLGSANTSVLNNANFTDTLTNMSVDSTTIGGTCVGVTNSPALVAGATGANALNLTVPNMPPGGCTVTVQVTSTNIGVNPNSVSAVTTTTAGVPAGVGAGPVNLTVLAKPTIVKAFSPATVGVSRPSVLTLTISNPTAGVLTGLAFTDTYPTNLVNAAVAGGVTTCTGGTVTAGNNGSSVALSGGSVPANGSCTVTVNVTSAAAGPYANTSGGVSSVETGVAGPASNAATLTVVATQLTKAFGPTGIGVNGVSTLTFTIANGAGNPAQENFGFTDNLPTGLTVVPGSAASQCGGSVSSTTTSITLSSASLTLGTASCTVTVNVTSNTLGSYTNNTSNISALSGGLDASGVNATLVVATAPTLTKAFAPVSIAPGTKSTLTFTVGNSSASAATAVAFTDTFPAASPAGGALTVASPLNITNSCGGALNNNLGGALAAGAAGVQLSGGAIAANGSCTITVEVTATRSGGSVTTFANTVPAGGLTTSVGTSLVAANATLSLPLPGITKVFSPQSVGRGNPSVLTITLTNTSGSPYTAAAFTDTYPTNLQNANTPAGATTCAGGTVIAVGNGPSVALSGGTIPANGSCTVTVNVDSGTNGTYLNTIPVGGLTTSAGANDLAASDTLVVGRPDLQVTKTHVGNFVVGSTGVYSLGANNLLGAQNSNNPYTITDTLPAGLTFVSAAGTGWTCTTDLPTVPTTVSCTNNTTINRATSNPNLITLTVNVLVAAFPSVSNSATISGGNDFDSTNNTVTDLTVVVGPPIVTKSFIPSVISPGQATQLRITLTNPNATVAITGAAFNDAYPSGLVNTATPLASSNCGGTASATANGISLGFTGGTIPANGSCVVTVNVTSAAAGSYTNTSGAVTTTNAGPGVADSATLTVLLKPTIAKSFAPATIPVGGTSVLTLTITNPGGAPLTGLAFTDTYPANLLNTAAPAGTTTCTGGTVIAADNGSSVALSGGSVPANGSCTVTVNVTSALAGSYVNTSGGVSSVETGSAGAVSNTATLTAESIILTVAKTTSTPSVTNTPTGALAGYTLTVTNSGTAAATGVNVTDFLPAGFTYRSTSAVTLNDTAQAASAYQVTTTGTQTLATPQWDTNPTGGFTINAGKTLVITFEVNVASSVVPGVYNNSASVTSTNATTTTNFDGAASTADDVTVSAPVGVFLNGTVYRDANHNLQLDGGELGTGLTPLYAKLISSGGSIALQVVTVNPVTGAYSFGAVTPGNYTIILDDNNVLNDIVPTVPVGWVGTEMPDFRRSNIQVATVDMQNLNFGLFNGGKLSGMVFEDTGAGGGTANDGIKNGGEPGIGGVTMKATNAAGTTTFDTTVTAADGSYTLWVPSATVAATLKIVETNLSGFVSTGASMGNTGGSYDRTTDATTLNNVSGGIFTGVNFGDVPVNRFVANGQQSGAPGNVLFYPHQFNAGSGGSVSLTVTSASSWPVVMYRDLNCNGVIDAIDTVVGGALTVVANEQICIVNKVTIPPGTGLGLQDAATLQAVFTYSNAFPALASTLAVIDSTTVGAGAAGLVLTKTTDKATALPGETITYPVNYQNNRSTPLGTIVISDATPAFTTFVSAACNLPLPTAITQCTVVTAPASGGGTSIQWTLTGSLNPASVGQVVFAVKVNN